MFHRATQWGEHPGLLDYKEEGFSLSTITPLEVMMYNDPKFYADHIGHDLEEHKETLPLQYVSRK